MESPTHLYAEESTGASGDKSVREASQTPGEGLDTIDGDTMPIEPAPHDNPYGSGSGQSQPLPDSANNKSIGAGEMAIDNQVNAENENGDNREPSIELEVEHGEAPKKKSKKRSKPKSKRGAGKPTGMEEYYADGPLTVEEAEAEQALYPPDAPFINRILTAIQRFERTKRLSPERRDVFYKYLAYGGIDVGPNMFQSKETLDTSDMTKDELAIAMSQVSIGTDKHNVDSPDAIYAIDFLGCMKAFLSRRASDIWGLETWEKTTEVTSTLERFMQYLLQRGVCPEYDQEVTETRNFCKKAAEELWTITQIRRRLPGDFNMACSTLCGGQFAQNYDGETYYGPQNPGEVNFVGLTKETANQIVGLGIACQAPEHVFQKHNQLPRNAETGGVVVKIEESRHSAGFEITRIEGPSLTDQEIHDIYGDRFRSFRRVCTVYAKPWENPERPPVDLSPQEQAQLDRDDPEQPAEEYVFLIEQAITLQMRMGMKVEATLHKLTSGIWFFDEFINLYPSFDTYLCNELMVNYKKPRWLEGSVQFAEQQERERLEEEKRKAAEAELEQAASGEAVSESERSGGNSVLNEHREQSSTPVTGAAQQA
ncbi:uncharacterized protein HMPREF1541_03626 [Cyphellophora europaea CBS 101466]|uniref:Argonaute siRNA chaperone complex subunit Arb1 n=1 Tax=Cyphellophora europaea (strain CBS 101466) TaxID=1220924 RepID=W2RZD2_CYPE1|nr:uncharacterized protein HMPREF1541_03626 [Cyphellophora europaea CBS 101466]ETN41690.1 hypothetical protein HMPREF1541_03626 [Cyphellophora europaea CBS 101466]